MIEVIHITCPCCLGDTTVRLVGGGWNEARSRHERPTVDEYSTEDECECHIYLENYVKKTSHGTVPAIEYYEEACITAAMEAMEHEEGREPEPTERD